MVITQVSQAMHDVLTTAAESNNRTIHFTRRTDQSTCSAITLTQTLVLDSLAHPDATRE